MSGTEDPAFRGIPLALFEAGDPRFVAEIRAVTDPEPLARFASVWLEDARPEARRLLFAYLDEPPNAPGHEGLAKRLFKRAEAAGDDAVMARFLVLWDRLIVRNRRVRHIRVEERFATLEEALACEAEWVAQGWVRVRISQPFSGEPGPYRVEGARPHLAASTRDTRLMGSEGGGESQNVLTAEQGTQRRWFKVATRRYLQRRVWRYFRKLGRTDPTRYLAAASTALRLYHASEPGDGFGLLDHSGLVHLLFGESEVVRSRSSGWCLSPGRALTELAPAPAFEASWADHPEAVLPLLGAPSAIVSRWALRWVERARDLFFEAATPAFWLALLDRADPELGTLALAMLERSGAGSVSLDDAVRLATSEAEPHARLGWGWVKGQGIAGVPVDKVASLLPLLDARCLGLRPAILAKLREELAGRGAIERAVVWALLDSRHADARAEGWAWFAATESLRNDPEFWSRLVDSPDLDIQAACLTLSGPLPAEPGRVVPLLRSVLLAPEGLAWAKPKVIRRMIARLEAMPEGHDDEVDALLSLLASLVQSAHAPERRSALAALVMLAERQPKWVERIKAWVPALQIEGGPAIVPA